MGYREISWKKWKMRGDGKDDKVWGVEHGARVFVYSVVSFSL